MKTLIRKITWAVFILGATYPLIGQSNYDIQLVLDTVDCVNNIACYNVQLRSTNGNNWGLAGQNYRLYYDAALASWQSGTSTLGSTYQSFTLVQDVQNVNASGTNGNLAFEDSLSFLNYTMDLNDPSTGGISFPNDTTWITTSRLCFSVSDSLLNDPNVCLEAVWARNGMTNEYATSFVEVSEWVMPNQTQMATGIGYNDLDATDGEGSCFESSCAGKYDIQLVIDTIDCYNNVACYNVQLRSTEGESWGLAGQNYRLYYNAALASWQSGVSTLPTSSYQPFTLIQDIQYVNASATNSNLSFEDSLSFLNYTMDLNDPSVGGIFFPNATTWITTSRLCFSLSDSLLENPSTCLEAVWGRDGLTNEYATSFVEVSEWVDTNQTRMANGIGYNDLDPTDGEGSCFDGSCLYDFGDLPDPTNATAANDYQTLLNNNGPRHLIDTNLVLGLSIDAETEGQPSANADGDGTDEDGIQIPSSLNFVPGTVVRLPLIVENNTGDTAHLEAWIDWNGDGIFNAIEMIADEDSDAGLPDYLEISIPPDALLNTPLGFRVRLSNMDNMTPYGKAASGEVEDYLLIIDCLQSNCMPINYNVVRKNN